MAHENITERKHAEAALHESERRYRSLVEHIPQAIFRLDRAGRITFANSRYCEATDRRLEDVMGKTDADLFPPGPAAQCWADSRRVMETGQPFETVERHDGWPLDRLPLNHPPDHATPGEPPTATP